MTSSEAQLTPSARTPAANTPSTKRAATEVSVARPNRGNPAVAGVIDSVLHKLISYQNNQSLGCLCIGIASSQKRVGVSTIANRLATQAALNGDGSVLLVEANWQYPSQQRLSGIKAGPGLINHLTEGTSLDQCIQTSSTRHLSILQCGSAKSKDISISPVELQGLFADLRNRYQVVFVDLPAITETGSSVFYAMMTDGVVVVLDGVSSKATATKDLVGLLEEHGVHVFGAIMNRYTPALPRWLRRWF